MTDDRRETTAWERQQADNELVAHARREAAERHRADRAARLGLGPPERPHVPERRMHLDLGEGDA